MPVPVSPQLVPTPNAIAELALLGSVLGREPGAGQRSVTGPALRQFWSANRALQHRWMSELSAVSTDSLTETEGFERIALELFLVEMLTRIWATNWTIADRTQGHRDIERILGNSIRGLDRVRREVLLLMVKNWRGSGTEMISRLDRFRRRSERWTDLLISGPAAAYGVWEFAVEVERAQDFGLESWSSAAGMSNPASLLVSAGLRVMFGTPWPLGCCRRKCFSEMLSAVILSLPPEALHDDGTLKPASDWQPG